MLRILRLARRKGTHNALSTLLQRIDPSLLQLLKLIVMLTIYWHYMGCVYWVSVDFEWSELAGKDASTNEPLADDDRLTGLSVLESDEFRASLQDHSWLPPTDILDAYLQEPPSTNSLSKVYLWSYFWAMSLTSGYQDFKPVSHAQARLIYTSRKCTCSIHTSTHASFHASSPFLPAPHHTQPALAGGASAPGSAV